MCQIKSAESDRITEEASGDNLDDRREKSTARALISDRLGLNVFRSQPEPTHCTPHNVAESFTEPTFIHSFFPISGLT